MHRDEAAQAFAEWRHKCEDMSRSSVVVIGRQLSVLLPIIDAFMTENKCMPLSYSTLDTPLPVGHVMDWDAHLGFPAHFDDLPPVDWTGDALESLGILTSSVVKTMEPTEGPLLTNVDLC
ncbi:MAG: hypothetical protein JKY23_00450 [Nitrospinaceae bacterium]|nr:hypothetical protein [Nitrospinaceae bacterium]